MQVQNMSSPPKCKIRSGTTLDEIGQILLDNLAPGDFLFQIGFATLENQRKTANACMRRKTGNACMKK